jgi:hypothetical protein
MGKPRGFATPLVVQEIRSCLNDKRIRIVVDMSKAEYSNRGEIYHSRTENVQLSERFSQHQSIYLKVVSGSYCPVDEARVNQDSDRPPFP